MPPSFENLWAEEQLMAFPFEKRGNAFSCFVLPAKQGGYQRKNHLGRYMTDKTLSRIVAAVIAMLLIFQIGSLISSLFGMAWGTVSSVVVAGVSFFSARIAKAGGKTSAWFLLPTILFTILPIAYTVWKVVTVDTGWLDMALKFGPFFIGFAGPVILLLIVFYELRKRIVN